MLGLTVLALSLGAPLRARPAPGAPARVAHCAWHAKPTLVGLEALRAACPGIGKAIEGLGLSAWLPEHWRKSITPRALAGLGALASRYGGRPLSAAPEPSALRAIARTLKPPLPPPGWWDRVKAWLWRRMAPLLHALQQWLDSVARSPAHRALAYALLYALGGLLLLTLAVFAYIELRSAGYIGSKRRMARPRAGAAPVPIPAAAGGEPDWSLADTRPACLLRVLIEALASTRRIERDWHLTCREICARARFDCARQRRDFEQLVQLAERELYGPGAPAPVPEETLRAAKALLAELLAAATAAVGAP
jgi:hypothetical protein